MSDFLKQFGEDLKTNVPGFIAVAFTEIRSGISYYALSTDPNFDPELASTFNLDVVKAKLNAINALGLKQNIKDIIINLESQIHFIDISENNQYFIYLTIDPNHADISLTKSFINNYKRDSIKKN